MQQTAAPPRRRTNRRLWLLLALAAAGTTAIILGTSEPADASDRDRPGPVAGATRTAEPPAETDTKPARPRPVKKLLTTTLGATAATLETVKHLTDGIDRIARRILPPPVAYTVDRLTDVTDVTDHIIDGTATVLRAPAGDKNKPGTPPKQPTAPTRSDETVTPPRTAPTKQPSTTGGTAGTKKATPSPAAASTPRSDRDTARQQHPQRCAPCAGTPPRATTATATTAATAADLAAHQAPEPGHNSADEHQSPEATNSGVNNPHTAPPDTWHHPPTHYAPETAYTPRLASRPQPPPAPSG